MNVHDARYALYLMPAAESLLWRLGSSLLGYDALTGEALPQPRFEAIAPDALATMTAHPRRYGFHMTIKAPFRLAQGSTPAHLIDAVRALASEQAAPVIPSLRLVFRRSSRGDRGFLCLEPQAVSDLLAALERAAIISLDRFRAPLTPEDIARRSPDQLTIRQRHLLDRFGYPFVLDEFRPHFSLTGPIARDQATIDAFDRFLRPALGERPACRFQLALFRQDGGAGPFRVEHIF